jgi:Zn-dependent protease/predicted transcriptional regulator
MPFIGKDRTLFRIFGLPIKANLSWLFLVGLVMFTLAEGLIPEQLDGQYAWYVRWGLAAAGTVGLFASLIVHELCHSLVARSTGMPVSGITLFIFGGVSQLEDEPPTAKAEFAMAVVGPLASIVLGGVFLGSFLVAKVLGLPQTVVVVVKWLGIINLVLAGFNSLPAFPLDGGRVVRSAIWAITDELKLATHVAANIGSMFGLGLILLGVFLLFNAVLPGLWLMVIGFFLRQSALGSLRMTMIREELAGEQVSRFMTTDLVTVPHDLPLDEFVQDYVFHHRFSYYPVVDEEGRLAGLVSAKGPADVEQEQWGSTTVQELMSEPDEHLVLDPDSDAVDALSSLRQREEHRGIVVEEGRPVGIVSLRDLLQFLALKIDLEPRRGTFE